MPNKVYSIKDMTETQKAYIAGIVDGEGSIVVTRVRRPENRSGYRFYGQVSIINNSKEMLDWVSEVSGIGKVYLKSGGSFGAKRQAYSWKTKHTQAKIFIETILPYLIIKKDSAENLIDFSNYLGLGGNYKNYDLAKLESFWDKSSELNKRGKLLDVTKPVESSKGKAMAVMREAVIYRKNNWNLKEENSKENKAKAKAAYEMQKLEAIYSQTPTNLKYQEDYVGSSGS